MVGATASRWVTRRTERRNFAEAVHACYAQRTIAVVHLEFTNADVGIDGLPER